MVDSSGLIDGFRLTAEKNSIIVRYFSNGTIQSAVVYVADGKSVEAEVKKVLMNDIDHNLNLELDDTPELSFEEIDKHVKEVIKNIQDTSKKPVAK